MLSRTCSACEWLPCWPRLSSFTGCVQSDGAGVGCCVIPKLRNFVFRFPKSFSENDLWHFGFFAGSVGPSSGMVAAFVKVIQTPAVKRELWEPNVGM